MIDSIELAIFASFLRTTLPAKKHRESKTLKRYTDDQKISPFGNRLRPRLGCMHSSAECNNNVIQTLVKKKKYIILTTVLTVFSHSLKKTVVFNNNNNNLKTIIIIMIIIVSHQVALSLIY